MPFRKNDLANFPNLQDLRKLADVDTSGAHPAPARHGRPGSCLLCQQGLVSHFDTNGRFLGCPAATDDITFVLMPVPASKRALPSPATTGPKPPQKRFRRGRYYYVGPKDIATLNLSDQRNRVAVALSAAGREGAVTNELVKATKLGHSSVTQALNWLEFEHEPPLIEGHAAG